MGRMLMTMYIATRVVFGSYRSQYSIQFYSTAWHGMASRAFVSWRAYDIIEAVTAPKRFDVLFDALAHGVD